MPKLSKKAVIQQYARDCNWVHVGANEWQQVRAARPEVSETTLRTALHELQLTIEQPFAGIDTKTLERLEDSLLSLSRAYPLFRAECRALAIAAKDRCRFAALNPKIAPETRSLKEEMVEWLLVWLGDPAMFADWVALRKRHLLQSQ